jgi:predicted ATP-dependent endonuclease of OLD family
MRIDFVEIHNFRRLEAIRIDFSEKTTLFVGANNSGKTSAIAALRYFLIEHGAFSTYDIPIALWTQIDQMSKAFEKVENEEPHHKWKEFLPSLDVWLNVSEGEIHHVAHLIPTLDWNPNEGIGVRMQLEPEKPDELLKAYLKAKKAACDTVNTKLQNEVQFSPTGDQKEAKQTEKERTCKKFALWPKSMMDFLKKRMSSFLKVKAYILDPSKKRAPINGVAQPQELPDAVEPLEGNPFKGLIKIDEVPAHRGLSDYSETRRDGDESEHSEKDRKQLLTAQLRSYYAKHLDPLKSPEPSDIRALDAIQEAQTVFDERLKHYFKAPLDELEQLGYPGVTNPRLIISTSIKPVEGLKHQSAVQYDVAPTNLNDSVPYRLPEQCNGLGYQNLISMVFGLIGFRDDWMKIGKAAQSDEETGEHFILYPPLHLILLEEPEAHLHVQVQQVFIRKAFDVLRNHPDLQGESPLSTQLVVSTHSSHIAHEVDFADMRYFRRHPALDSCKTPTSTVVNLSEIFGSPDETAKFVSRYLRATHADLFFADGAILVEGSAERMLVPYFIQQYHEKLQSCYITILEVGGSHAHRLRKLIEHLGLNTLIITDIDAVNEITRQRDTPKRKNGLITANNVIKEWHPEKKHIDEFIDLREEDKEKAYDQFFSIRVAYQTPVQIAIKKNSIPSKEEAVPRTFEDSLVLENIDFFRNARGQGFIKKAKDAIESGESVSELHDALLDELKNATKAGFALDMLFSDDLASIKVPGYIQNGLVWLENKLLQRQKEVQVMQIDNTEALEEGAK